MKTQLVPRSKRTISVIQDRQSTYNVTIRRVRVTTNALEKQ